MEEDKATTITLSSPLSSPTHEFSFTITLHPSPNSSPNHMSYNNDNKKPPKDSFALDLAPADDIFFHGHLLPLQQLISRHSDVLAPPAVNYISATDTDHDNNGKKRIKNKPFSFWKKWLKLPNDHPAEEEEEDHNKWRRRKTFDFSRFWKKYTRFFSSEKRCGNSNSILRKPYSFSVNSKENGKWVRKRGRYSAPASRWTSPSNSGVLSVVPSSDDSSMEALQSAIQAAIAHCKDSTTYKVREEIDIVT